MQLWRAISDEVDSMRIILASKEEELWNKYNEKGDQASKVQDSHRQLLDEIGHMRSLLALKVEELQNCEKVFHTKMEQRQKFRRLKWCSSP
ncbi:hypothetical protein PanWU01x14_005440 [Parasponia andersonii]|uniref:Uncharacterized protein n=1 Tax=Parasponia andersonii TaxID=3476 RepID=A0A2P5E3I1_PARAD|nr:hypothetical protein PanWU01x14_005440 [Parasponia andersonii]